MPKNCKYKECNNPVFSKGYCKFHQYLRIDKLSRSKPKQKSIKKFSSKMRAKIAEYIELREEFLKQEPLCKAKLEECTRIATDIHHTQGRTGNNFLNVQTWLPVCRRCHIWIEEHPKEAKEKNLSKSRLKKR